MHNKIDLASSGKAEAELYGTLDKNVELKTSKNGDSYGVLSITVTRASGKTNRFTVFIWNQKLLEIYTNDLKKGATVWMVGELEIIRKPKSNSAGTFNSMTINIRHGRGIVIQDEIGAIQSQNAGESDFVPANTTLNAVSQ